MSASTSALKRKAGEGEHLEATDLGEKHARIDGASPAHDLPPHQTSSSLSTDKPNAPEPDFFSSHQLPGDYNTSLKPSASTFAQHAAEPFLPVFPWDNGQPTAGQAPSKKQLHRVGRRVRDRWIAQYGITGVEAERVWCVAVHKCKMVGASFNWDLFDEQALVGMYTGGAIDFSSPEFAHPQQAQALERAANEQPNADEGSGATTTEKAAMNGDGADGGRQASIGDTATQARPPPLAASHPSTPSLPSSAARASPHPLLDPSDKPAVLAHALALLQTPSERAVRSLADTVALVDVFCADHLKAWVFGLLEEGEVRKAWAQRQLAVAEL